MKLNLKAKIIVNVVTLTIISLTVMGIVSSYISYSSLQTLKNHQMKNTTTMVSQSGSSVTKDEYVSAASKIRNYTIFMIFIFVLIGIASATILANRIVVPIKNLEKLMREAGQGDISVQSNIKTGDEIEELGNCFNDMIKHQSTIVSHVRSGSKELMASADSLSASSQEISASVQEINASMQEVSSNTDKQDEQILNMSQALVELSSLVQLAQNKAVSADKNSVQATAAAKDGRIKVKETVEAMELIKNSTNESDKIMSTLEQLSTKVGGIISTINSIAEQTNLLALNAAIEAARAGESGKGFSVVAEQIRKLSEESNTGANEVSSLINQMVDQIKTAVISMKNAKDSVKNGVSIVNDTDQTFISILNTIDITVKQVREILDVTSDEVATSDQIVKIIDSIASTIEANDSMTRQVASTLEEQSSAIELLASTAEETDAMAVSLEKSVEHFKTRE